MSKSFDEQLAENLGQSQRQEYREAYDALRTIAEGISKYLSQGKSRKNFEANLELGYQTNLGQQFRMRFSASPGNWEETLLRAYVPPDGFPISLDLGGEEQVRCSDVASLEREVLSFLKKPEIDGRLSIVRDEM